LTSTALARRGAAGEGHESQHEARRAGPTLLKGLPADAIAAVAAAGRTNMPPFGRVYTGANLRDIAAHITDVLAR